MMTTIHKNENGYIRIGLTKDGKRKMFQVHQLVAQTFLENPNNYSQINHKDENKINNNAEILEWCSPKYNSNYGTRNEKVSKKVYQYTLDGEFVREWKSIKECGRNGFVSGNIYKCCNGKRNKHKGYKWEYK